VRLEAETSDRVARIAAELDAVVAERDRLLRERASARPVETEEPSAGDGVEVVTVAPAGRQRTRDDADDAEEDETPSPPPRPLEIAGTGPIVVVLDVESGWERVVLEEHRIAVLPPADDLAAQLREIEPARVVANLAAPGIVDTLIALRGAGYAGRVWGCLANPAGDRALALGMVEVASAPLDPDLVLSSLGPFGGRGTRVVTAGADVDVLMSLRQALTRGGMSVSMAWDGKQAWDLLGVVRPEVTVVDLALPRRDGYAIAAAAHGETSGVTVIVRAKEDPAPPFAAVLNDPSQVGRAVPLAQLLAAQLKRSESPAPKAAPQKMRVQGGGGHTVVRSAAGRS
jgi:CheY-like chemotaxis protein